MKNIGLMKYENSSVDDFTSDIGIKIRRKIHPYLKVFLNKMSKQKIEVIDYPELSCDKQYIFVSLHGFVEDSVANLATIDRSAYFTFGTTDQLHVNKEMYAAWLNGFIYINRLDKKSRNDAILKMKRILESGSSVTIFPEGGFNNTENLLCQKLFSSPFILSKMTGCEIVPIAPYYELGDDTIYMKFGEPIDLSKFKEKEEALSYLRDVLSSLLYEFLLSKQIYLKRSELGSDPRMDYMKLREAHYRKTNWTYFNADEELTQYKDESDREFESVWESFDNISITKENATIMAPILKRRCEQKKYDFKSYMNNVMNK